MPKLNKRLQEARDNAILFLYDLQYTAEEIGIIFDLTTSSIYNIIKEKRKE